MLYLDFGLSLTKSILIPFACQFEQKRFFFLSNANKFKRRRERETNRLKVVKTWLNSEAIASYSNLAMNCNAYALGLFKFQTKCGISMQYKLFKK